MRRTVFLAATCLLLASCARQAEPIVQAPPPVVVAAPAPMPLPPAGATPNLVLPMRLADGRFDTPVRATSGPGTLWHLRAALNVAALGCRDAQEAQTVAQYNQLLATKKAALADADARLRGEYKARFGAGWQDAHDDAMTRVYNFFALPPVHREFCAAARIALAEAVATDPKALAAAAPALLTRIETPFQSFFAAYADYRQQLAQRQGPSAPQLTVASAVLTGSANVISPY
jgi:hypothetical protein